MSSPQLDIHDSAFLLATGYAYCQLDIELQMPGAFPMQAAVATSPPSIQNLFSLSPLSSLPSSVVESSELEVQNYLLSGADWSPEKLSVYSPRAAKPTTLQQDLIYALTTVVKRARSVDPLSWIKALAWAQLEKMGLTTPDSPPVIKEESLKERSIPRKYTTYDMSTSLLPALLL